MNIGGLCLSTWLRHQYYYTQHGCVIGILIMLNMVEFLEYWPCPTSLSRKVLLYSIWLSYYKIGHAQHGWVTNYKYIFNMADIRNSQFCNAIQSNYCYTSYRVNSSCMLVKYCYRAMIKSPHINIYCHLLIRILCRVCIMTSPKKKRETSETNQDNIHHGQQDPPQLSDNLGRMSIQIHIYQYFPKPIWKLLEPHKT